MKFRRWMAMGALAPVVAMAQTNTTVCGEIRVQVLSPTLVRIEKKGPKGFEDRPTFNVVNRKVGSVGTTVREVGGTVTIRTKHFTVRLPRTASELTDVVVESPKGEVLYKPQAKNLPSQFLPSPGKMPKAWAMSDGPRMVPPKWGATPAPTDDPSSGWDRGNDSPDLYVFVPDSYQGLRHDFLALTGSIEKPPLYAFGFIDSRYHPYTEKEAIGVIDTYRRKQIPLDIFVVDTDWRINGSHGYEVEPKYFPDMPRFLKEAHQRNVKVMFNDHPEPATKDALDPVEMKYRYEGITKFLGMGLDVWWYDRNWWTSFREPMPGLAHEVWGQQVYHDMTLRFRPDQRPLIMSNFQGIDNGIRHYAPKPAGHRYPIWWTGDTQSRWEFLRRGVENGVDMGVLALSPYVGEDLGGHVGMPSPELYVRYLQYGCLSPTTRIHCTRGNTRYPWEFGAEAEGIVTDFIRLRYRLLPTIYSAAQRATEDGTPLLRRLDLEWPTYAEAARNDEYLLGDDLLVAPIVKSDLEEAKPVPTTGLKAEFYRGTELQGEPILTRNDRTIAFDWGNGSPAPGIPNENFSARWTGEIGPVEKGGEYTFVTRSDDGIRLWIDDKKVIDSWVPLDAGVNQVKVRLEAGSRHNVRLEYFEKDGGALVSLGWIPPSDAPRGVTKRDVWLPPGEWRSLYTGEVTQGPRTVPVAATLNQCPMWVRSGGLVTLAPEVQYTGERPWNELTLDAWVPSRGGRTVRTLSEDDGGSNEYLHGAVAKTKVEMSRSGGQVTLRIGGASGNYKGLPGRRSWRVRLNLPAGADARSILLDGRPVRTTRVASGGSVPIPLLGGTSAAAGGVVHVVDIPASSIRQGHTITFDLR